MVNLKVFCICLLICGIYTYKCFTFYTMGQDVIVSCMVENWKDLITIKDSSGSTRKTCRNLDSDQPCLIRIKIQKDDNGLWRCKYSNETLNLNISLQEGYINSAKKDLINFGVQQTVKGQNHSFKLTCSTCWNPFGNTSVFYLNDEYAGGIRYTDNKCYHQNDECDDIICSCLDNPFRFSMTYMVSPYIKSFGCEMRFHDLDKYFRVKQKLTYIRNGTGFVYNNTVSQIKVIKKGYTTNTGYSSAIPTKPTTPDTSDSDVIENNDNRMLIGTVVGVIGVCCLFILFFIYITKKDLPCCKKERPPNDNCKVTYSDIPNSNEDCSIDT